MKKVAEEQVAKAVQEAAATIEEMVLPSTEVTFGAGATVQRVLTGCETCKVLVMNLPLTATKAEVVTLFTQPGFDPTKFTVHPPRPSPIDWSHLEAVVEFKHLENGMNAVAGLDEIEFGSEKVKLVLISTQGDMGKFKGLDSRILTVMWPAPSFTARTTPSYNLDGAIPTLRSLVIRAHPQGHHSVTYELNLVPNERGMISAKIHFSTWEHARAVRDFLDEMPLPFYTEANYSTFLPDPVHYTMDVPYPQYKAQEELFRPLIPTPTDQSATTHLRILADQPDQPTRIELSGSDKKAVGRLKVRIEHLTAGEKLSQWDRAFSSAKGERFLAKVDSESGAYVLVDKHQCTLKAFGEPAAVERAKAMIQEEVDRLASLQLEVGEGNVMLVVTHTLYKVVVRGGEHARHLLRKLIDEPLSDTIRSQHQLKDAGETCPVCYDTIDQSYRLGCGHAYCHSCLHHFLVTASDTKQFPLSCMGDEGKCGVPIPLPVIQWFLVPAQVKRLLEVSLLDHLDRHPGKFKYCATPDCPEIYSLESNSRGETSCRSCFVSVCVSCGENHEGFSCEEWKIHRDSEAQERLLEGWAEGSEHVKKCPECKILIEKNGGCNHMTCPKCGVHICWRCLGVFTANNIYNHMTVVHGGMLDGDEPHVDDDW